MLNGCWVGKPARPRQHAGFWRERTECRSLRQARHEKPNRSGFQPRARVAPAGVNLLWDCREMISDYGPGAFVIVCTPGGNLEKRAISIDPVFPK